MSLTNSNERLQQISQQLNKNMSTQSIFENIGTAPPDAIFNLMNNYKNDPADFKVNLSVGAYRTDKGTPWILPVVAKAEKAIIEDPNSDHEYLGIEGLKSFTEAAVRLLLGDNSDAIKGNRYATVQTVSGTGANSTFATFCKNFYQKQVYVSSPTWGNHHNIFTSAGLEVVNYPYFDKETRGLDFNGMYSSIENAPNGSIILLHACAHNPTGVDPTRDQWKKFAELISKKEHLTFFDCAYQGFASGDVENDAWAIQHFVNSGLEVFIAQSFAKNFGLYGERCGALTAVTKTPQAAAKVLSQLKKISRATISNPPKHGAQIVSRVLNDPTLKAEWFSHLKEMSSRIALMRKQLYDYLLQLKTPGTWEHIINQIGMFSFTGLNAQHAKYLKEKYHVYLTDNGRISMAGLNSSNVEYFAKAIDDAVRNC